MKNVVILGSTGSVGMSTLEVVTKESERFKVVGLAAGSNAELMAEQIRRFKPKAVSLMDESAANRLSGLCRDTGTQLYSGIEGLLHVATMKEGDIVMAAIVGAAGLIPTMAAIKAEKTVALANKETMVMAGKLIREEAFKKNVKIIPIDSEHNAIFQILASNKRHDVKKVILTASGGPLLDSTDTEIRNITPMQVTRHPTYRMGAKISVDSATLMNKGLEMIEAKWLFDMQPENIDVIVHRQSIVHSMVEFKDQTVMAVMGNPDMKMPISYGLNYPERVSTNLPSLDLAKVGSLTFEQPDYERFPCLQYAYDAVKVGGTMPSVLNGANEEAVKLFLDEQIRFADIPRLIKETTQTYTPVEVKKIEDVLLADTWAREKVGTLAASL